jgi:hypothetical protein
LDLTGDGDYADRLAVGAFGIGGQPWGERGMGKGARPAVPGVIADDLDDAGAEIGAGANVIL